jgi:asparagine synthase (glutamine-hydrolysing)
MCGIAGVVGHIAPLDAEAAVKKMVQVLARRGPDSEGIEMLAGAVLGHRRLAIFDVSQAGRQPMVSADGSTGIVFNGAIYNFRDLRAELIARGYSFASHTDTEVLLHGYREWGIDKLISQLRGMFAFGLWDSHTRRLCLVRDRLGVKPLVYTVRDGMIAFASTVSALRTAGYVGDLDENAVMDFLEFGFVTDERSIYRDAEKVPAASVVEWCDGTLTSRQYWTSPLPDVSHAPTFPEAVEETERLLLRSVESRLHADVPVGALLSGGIDSALVCWAIAKLGANITAYTVGTPGDPWDETADSTATAQLLGIEHRVLEMSAGEGSDLQELVSAYAEPFACASALGMLRVSRAVAQSAKVLLTGDGGDDVFLGYPDHRNLWLAENFSSVLPSAAADCWYGMRSRFPRIGPLRRAATFLDYATGGLGILVNSHNGFPFHQCHGILGNRLLAFSTNVNEIPISIDAGRRVLHDFLDYHLKTRFVGEYMTKVDGATMHYAIEARSPFLDHALWEFASSLPVGLRLHRGRLKAILRELVRQRIGWTVARRKKSGFGIPVRRWIAGAWSPLLESVLHESILDKEGWISSRAALSLLKLARTRGWGPDVLWYILVLELWARRG